MTIPDKHTIMRDDDKNYNEFPTFRYLYTALCIIIYNYSGMLFFFYYLFFNINMIYFLIINNI